MSATNLQLTKRKFFALCCRGCILCCCCNKIGLDLVRDQVRTRWIPVLYFPIFLIAVVSTLLNVNDASSRLAFQLSIIFVVLITLVALLANSVRANTISVAFMMIAGITVIITGISSIVSDSYALHDIVTNTTDTDTDTVEALAATVAAAAATNAPSVVHFLPMAEQQQLPLPNISISTGNPIADIVVQMYSSVFMVAFGIALCIPIVFIVLKLRQKQRDYDYDTVRRKNYRNLVKKLLMSEEQLRELYANEMDAISESDSDDDNSATVTMYETDEYSEAITDTEDKLDDDFDSLQQSLKNDQPSSDSSTAVYYEYNTQNEPANDENVTVSMRSVVQSTLRSIRLSLSMYKVIAKKKVAKQFRKCRRFLKRTFSTRSKSKHSIFEQKTDFYYPTRFIAGIVAGWTLTLLAMIYISFYVNLIASVMASVLAFAAKACANPEAFYCVIPFGSLSGDTAVVFSYVLTYSVIAMTLAIISLLTFLMFKNYRNNIMLLRQGKQQFQRKSYNVVEASYYIGHQAGRFFFGTVMLMTFLTIATAAVLALVVAIAFFTVVKELLIRVLSQHAAIITIVMLTANLVVGWFAKIVFSAHHGALIRNFIGYSVFDAVMTIYSAFSGFVNAFVRGLILPVLMYSFTYVRMDVTFLGGHNKIYHSMLLMDFAHNHPILITFADIMMEHVRELRHKRDSHAKYQPPQPSDTLSDSSHQTNSVSINVDAEQQEHRKQYKYRNYWYLLITLHNNRSLIELRRPLGKPQPKQRRGIIASALSTVKSVASTRSRGHSHRSSFNTMPPTTTTTSSDNAHTEST